MTSDPIEAAAVFRPSASAATAITAHEEVLCGVFADVLGVPDVAVDGNFYDLGGHSLLIVKLIRRIRRALDIEVGVDEIFDNPTPAAVARLLAAKPGSRQSPVAAPRPAVVPLSPGQRRLWYLDRLDTANGAYNIPVVLRLSGPLDSAALRAALQDTVARHEILRTVIAEVNGEPSQQILPADVAALPFEHVATRPEQLETALAHDAGYVFDLRSELPVRVRLHSLGAQQHALIILLHHIAADGSSIGPLCHDLAEAYAARCAGHAPAWEPLPLQYADYTLRQQRRLGVTDDPDSLASRQLGYWREALVGLPEEIALPLDRPRQAAGSGAEGFAEAVVDAQVHRRLANLARSEGLTMFMIAQAAVAMVLHLSGAGDDIPLGTPVEGRFDESLEPLVGLFVNTLVLRTVLSGDPSLTDVLRQVRATALAGYAHQDLPFDQLVEELNPARRAGRLPLYQVSVTWIPADRDRPSLPGLRCELGVAGPAPAAKFPLAFEFADRRGPDGEPAEVSIEIAYDSALFEHSTALQLAEATASLLAALADQPTMKLSDIADDVRVRGRRLVAGTGRRLVAYLVPAPGCAPDIEELTAHLGGLLPDYMVPTTFVTLDTLPLTSNGKLDRAALPPPEQTAALAPHVDPRTELEKTIAAVWGEVLHHDHVGVHDNFFALGGDSIESLRIVSRLAKLGVTLTPRDLLEHQTVAKLAVAVPHSSAEQGAVTGTVAKPIPRTTLSKSDVAMIAERFG